MLDINGETNLTDHQDSYIDMVRRRMINEEFALTPVDFNVESLRLANRIMSLEPSDLILDVGTSSGEFIINAARITGTKAQIIGVEPDERASDYRLSVDGLRSNFISVVGHGENLPIADNTFKVTTAHNVLFRAKDKFKMIDEVKRVTLPDGLIIISTNARNHGFWRHLFERVVANVLAEDTGASVNTPDIPAEGAYLEQLPDMLNKAGGLPIVARLDQKTAAKITHDRVPDFLYAVKFAANRSNIKPELRHKWRMIVDQVIEPFVLSEIAAAAESNAQKGIDCEPYFSDVIHRGMIVARNCKPC